MGVTPPGNIPPPGRVLRSQAPAPPRTAGEAWKDAWAQAWIMLCDHIPLMVGAALVGGIHKARAVLLPGDGRAWQSVIDVTLLAAEISLFFSLVVTKGVDLVGEFGVAVGVAWRRIVHAFKTGKRLPSPPRP
jgi:hypothetical protein